MKRLATAMLFAPVVALVLWAPRAWAAEALSPVSAEAVRSATETDIAKLVKEAKTPADYEAIAVWYDNQAKLARAQAQKFGALSDCYRTQENKAVYKGASLGARVYAHDWCNLRAHRYLSEAQQDEQLAKMNRAIAARLEKTTKP